MDTASLTRPLAVSRQLAISNFLSWQFQSDCVPDWSLATHTPTSHLRVLLSPQPCELRVPFLNLPVASLLLFTWISRLEKRPAPPLCLQQAPLLCASCKSVGKKHKKETSAATFPQLLSVLEHGNQVGSKSGHGMKTERGQAEKSV